VAKIEFQTHHDEVRPRVTAVLARIDVAPNRELKENNNLWTDVKKKHSLLLLWGEAFPHRGGGGQLSYSHIVNDDCVTTTATPVNRLVMSAHTDFL